MITSVAESNAEISGTLTEIAIGDTLVSGTPLSPAEFDEEAFGDDESITASVEDEFEDTQAQLQGVLLLQDDAYFEMGLNPYDIPPIRPDMLVEKLPDPLDTWGGPEASTDDGITTYIWNYGLASPTGLPFDRAILCFYTYDFKFK